MRHTLFPYNVSVYLSPKSVKTCILLSGLDLQGLYFNEKGPSEITAENNAEFFIILEGKLFKQKHSHTIFYLQIDNIHRIIGGDR